MELLREYCMGDKPCPVQLRSNFTESKFECVNYEDPNYNVSIPVFTIHGNHDDPTGDRSLSSIDLLGVANLLNYFGKTNDVEKITISPLLLEKGTTKLALYGLGSIRDERLNRTFHRKNVTFLRPKESTNNWFNLFVLHQNRIKHSSNNYIPASCLPSFLDLVVWGHEHESHTSLDYQTIGDITYSMDEDNMTKDEGFYIYQPGSSVATSLCEGEVADKHVGLLFIKGTEFKFEPLQLQTVRPFVMESIALSKTDLDPYNTNAIMSYLMDKVETLIATATAKFPNSNKNPLIRLKVDYGDGYRILNQARFCQNFVDKVANPKTILHWHRRKKNYTLARGNDGGGGEDEEDQEMDDFINEDGEEQQTIASLLKETLLNSSLNILSEKNLVDAVNEFVEKSEKDAISDFVKCSLKQTQEFLKSEEFSNEPLEEIVEKKREEILKIQEEQTEQIMATLRTSRPKSKATFSDESEDEEGEPMETESKGRGRGRGRGRGSRGGGRGATKTRGSRGKNTTITTTSTTTATTSKGTSSKRSAKTAFVYQSDYDDDDEDKDISLPARKKAATFSPSLSIDLTQDDVVPSKSKRGNSRRKQ
jgi:double-strand break repair protein MRE11